MVSDSLLTTLVVAQFGLLALLLPPLAYAVVRGLRQDRDEIRRLWRQLAREWSPRQLVRWVADAARSSRRIAELVEAGDRAEAVRRYREQTGASQPDAEAAIERMAARRRSR